MARTIAEIHAEMIVSKNAESGLAGLTSTSLTAIWNLILYICAVAIKVTEDLFDVLITQVENRRLEIPVGVLKWYASESLNYQYGDTLNFTNTFVDEDGNIITLIGNLVTYDIITPANRVVDLSAADIVNGVIVIKVAKVTTGIAEKLSVLELAGFTQYWVEKRIGGESITIISQDPDLLKAMYLVTYNPQLLSPTGESLITAGLYPVEAAINSFLQTFQSDEFAGTMKVMRLTDAIQGASGVVNAVAINVEGKPDGGSYIDILAISQQTYLAKAGYIKIDPAFPLSTTITYIPQ